MRDDVYYHVLLIQAHHQHVFSHFLYSIIDTVDVYLILWLGQLTMSPYAVRKSLHFKKNLCGIL